MKEDFDRALIIDEPHLGRILSGDKIWEMRSRPTNIRGHIGLIRKGSGLIIGSAELYECGLPLSEFNCHRQIHYFLNDFDKDFKEIFEAVFSGTCEKIKEVTYPLV